MLERIGFFNFTESYDKPFHCLETALEAHACAVQDSLIVLPEAFNYGRAYAHAGFDQDKRPRFSVDQSLAELAGKSEDRGVAFVVSLLGDPYNSAYLISGGKWSFVRHKEVGDTTKSYTPYCGDSRYVVDCDGTHIGVLICNEIEVESGVFAKCRSALDACGTGRKVICVPACMTSGRFAEDCLVPRWSDVYVALANTRPWPDGCRSFVANTKGTKTCSTMANEIVLMDWDTLGRAMSG